MLADRFPPRGAGFSVAILDNVTLDARRLHPDAEAGEGGIPDDKLHWLDVGGEGDNARRADHQGQRRLFELSEAVGAGRAFLGNGDSVIF
jgi:hypothetical protein